MDFKQDEERTGMKEVKSSERGKQWELKDC